MYANTFTDRQTMVWAIDLDDRSFLAALSYVSTEEKEDVLLELDLNIQDFGTNRNFVPRGSKDNGQREDYRSVGNRAGSSRSSTRLWNEESSQGVSEPVLTCHFERSSKNLYHRCDHRRVCWSRVRRWVKDQSHNKEPKNSISRTEILLQ